MPEFSGDGVPVLGSKCPKCGALLEYNGNYWCSEFACPYVMGERHEVSGEFRKGSLDARAWASIPETFKLDGRQIRYIEDF